VAQSADTSAGLQGRPRSEKARRAILEAAIELVKCDGFAAVTVEAIAARAGVSKATIYRWWPNKAAVVADGFLELTAPEVLFFMETGSVREHLKLQMHELARVLASENGKLIAALLAEGQADPEVAKTLRSHWISPRREATREILRHGIEHGELRADIDLEATMDALYGPIYYRLLGGHAPLDEHFIEALADHVMVGLNAPYGSNKITPIATTNRMKPVADEDGNR
jgi:AcrR family transcriptional regulator